MMEWNALNTSIYLLEDCTISKLCRTLLLYWNNCNMYLYQTLLSIWEGIQKESVFICNYRNMDKSLESPYSWAILNSHKQVIFSIHHKNICFNSFPSHYSTSTACWKPTADWDINKSTCYTQCHNWSFWSKRKTAAAENMAIDSWYCHISNCTDEIALNDMERWSWRVGKDLECSGYSPSQITIPRKPLGNPENLCQSN
jgi:hypothetical protein